MIEKQLRLDVGCGDFCRGDICLDVVKTKDCNILGDACSLPFQNNCFDHLIAQALLEHLENPTEGLREFMRVLKPNGTATIIVPKPWFTNNSRFYFVRFMLNLPLSLFPPFLNHEFMSLRRLKRERRMQHKSVISQAYMEKQARKLSFKILQYIEIEDLFCFYFPRRLLRKYGKLRKLFKFKPKLYDAHKIVCQKNVSD